MRLIDADAFIRFLAEQKVKETGAFTKGVNKALNIAISALKNPQITPAVDAVPVVRCRECRYYAASGATTSFCIHPGGMKFTSDSDYCSRGKRRDQSADVRNMGKSAGDGKTSGGTEDGHD